MTGFEIVFTFYMFVNLMNLDAQLDERDARITALEQNQTVQTTNE